MKSHTQEMSNQQFSKVCQMIENISGIHITNSKKYLIESRLTPLLDSCQLSSFDELCLKVEQGDPSLETQIIDAMTTNESLWFRDTHPFKILQDELLPLWINQLRQGQRQTVRIWSCACSSGQEPYSLAMILCEQKKIYKEINPQTFQIFATDISQEIIASAQKAAYDTFSISRGLNEDLKERYFKLEDSRWLLTDAPRQFVKFKLANLQDSFSSYGKFDAVFCRNVIIYFSDDFKKELFAKIYNVLNPEGVLFLGSSESIGLYSDQYEQVVSQKNKGSYYKK